MRFTILSLPLLGTFGIPLCGGGDGTSSSTTSSDDTGVPRLEGNCYTSNTPAVVAHYGVACELVECCNLGALQTCWFEGTSGIQYECNGRFDCFQASRDAFCAECEMDATTAAQAGC